LTIVRQGHDGALNLTPVRESIQAQAPQPGASK
jgi:hypothetical protein